MLSKLILPNNAAYKFLVYTAAACSKIQLLLLLKEKYEAWHRCSKSFNDLSPPPDNMRNDACRTKKDTKVVLCCVL